MRQKRFLSWIMVFTLLVGMFSFPAYAEGNAATTTISGDGTADKTGTMTITLVIPKKTPAATDLTYTAPSDLAYSGSDKAATVEAASGVTGMGTITVKYYSDASRTTEATPKNVGTYYVGATVAEGDQYAASTAVLCGDGWTFEITASTPDAPAAPTKASATKNSITLNAVSGCEYSKDGTNWQSGTEFTGLTPGMEYTFYQRVKATANTNASSASAGASFSTETDTYAMTITLTIKEMVASAENVSVAYDGQPHGITVNVTDPTSGYTVKYGTAEGTYDLDASPTQTEVGTQTVYYQVTANNYVTKTGSATVTISKAPPHVHSYTSVVTKEPTCTAAGIRTYTCACGDSYTETIPALGHDYRDEITKAPTTTEEGVITYTCTRCGHTYTERIPKLSGELLLYEKAGKSYEMRSSKKLNVGAAFTLVPRFNDGNIINERVVWTSSNPDVATVSQDGRVTARSGGRTTITVRSEERPALTSYCLVSVTEPVTGITLDKTSYTFGAGESVTITAQVLPFTAIQELAWTANNSNVKIETSKDTLSAKITGVLAGNAKVTASATDGSGKKATCSFTVGNPVPTFTISGKNNATVLAAGKTLAMTVSWGGLKPKNAGLTWEVNNTSIASVSSKGVLTGISEGTVRVTATSMANPDRKATADINVYIPVKSVVLNTTSGTVSQKSGANGLQLSVKITPAISGKEATGEKLGSTPTVSYTVDSKYAQYLSVNEKTGLVTAGTMTGKNIPVKATVTAYNGYQKILTCKVTVKDQNALKGIKLNKSSLSIGEGNTAALTASLNPINPDGDTGMTWESSNTSVARVDQSGNIVGVKAGTAKITVKANGTVLSKGKETHPAAACKVTVMPSVIGITFTNVSTLESKGLATGKSYTIKTKLALSGKGKAASSALLWISSDEAIATVTQKGVVKAKAPGLVTITAVSKDNKAGTALPPSRSVTFTTYAAVTSVKLDKTKLVIGTQTESQYGKISIAKVLPFNVSDPSISWTANNGYVQLAAIPAGSSISSAETSFATAGNGKGITTKPGEILAVKAMAPGVTKLTGITTDGSKKKVTCTVTVRGQVTGLRFKISAGKNGYNNVTQNDNTETAAIKYTGTMKANSSLTITPVLTINNIHNEGSTKKTYAAYAKYTDTSVSYRSSDTSIATVNKNGKITVKKTLPDRKTSTKGQTVTIYAASADGRQTAEIKITVK